MMAPFAGRCWCRAQQQRMQLGIVARGRGGLVNLRQPSVRRVVVTVRGARPRTVPVLARYHARLLAAARFAGAGLICGGADPGGGTSPTRSSQHWTAGRACPGWAPPGWARRG